MELTRIQMDALSEIINIGVGKGAAVLNKILNSHIQLRVPLVKILDSTELINELKEMGNDKLSSVNLGFKGTLYGTAQLIFSSENASELVATVTGEDIHNLSMDDISFMRSGTLSEIGNIVLNSVMGTFSNMLSLPLHFVVPGYIEDYASNLYFKMVEKNTAILLAKTQFSVEKLSIHGDIVLLFEVPSMDVLIHRIDQYFSQV
ncbi:MAG: chemotaxis protein CheC [Desulfobacterales bacterium]|nr:chemotaxis protein CheC [Desulfobacterales bacterium]